MSPARIRSLDELMAVLSNAPNTKNDDQQSDFATTHGLPIAHGEIDWTSLPVFGGDDPQDTQGVWSWDATRLLVGSCSSDLRIVPRSDVRDQRIEIRVSTTEREQIQNSAADAGLSVSEFLRRTALGV
jgi:hypothetical protein